MAIAYSHSSANLTASQLHGFFAGWPNPPAPETHLRLLRQSDEVVLAIEDGTGMVVGFITALTDRTLSAFIPLLEVLPSHQHRGIGGELARRMIVRLENLYSIDLLCDPAVQPFYDRLGLRPATGMMLRRYQYQSGPSENA